MSSYRVAPIFVIRVAGVPFDVLERLATRNSAAVAREIIKRREKLTQIGQEAERFLGSPSNGLSAEASRASRAALRVKVPNHLVTPDLPPSISRFAETQSSVFNLEAKLETTLRAELENARRELLKASLKILPDYLVFGAGDFKERLADLEMTATETLHAPRNARVRERDRRLLLYLQRLCAKNDTFSRFGPSAWGSISNKQDGVSFSPEENAFECRSLLERWTAHTLAAALNQDSEVREELSPRLNPNGSIEGENFASGDASEPVPLTPAMLQIIARCDGKTPAFRFEGAESLLTFLAAAGVIRWEVEVPALEAHAFEVLVSDISRWRDNAVRKKWLDVAQAIGILPLRFTATSDAGSRAKIMAEARRLLSALGSGPRDGGRFLYAATNPIVEECVRRIEFRINEAVVGEVAHDGRPWFDLWRDTYAFVASRVAESLRRLLQAMPRRSTGISLPAFLTFCSEHRMPLTGPGIAAPAHLAFNEVKEAFRQLMRDRSHSPECELSAWDCEFVRRNFPYQSFDEYTYPSADLQLAASSFASVQAGDYQWMVSELHPPVALLQHALYWGCSDKSALTQALKSTLFGKPTVHYGFFATDFTAHTTVEQMDALPDLHIFAAPQRSNPRWQTIRPAEVEVFVEEDTGDIAMRRFRSREYLGSFARSWLISVGLHPFQFGIAPHTPRLRCGNVIVQRQTWTVGLEELRHGDFTGISRDLVLAIEELRAEKDWPRHVYIRPTEQALRRSGAEGRDKDTKPVYIDLESYLSLEIFHRWLKKAGELEVTEMLPDPDHLCWQEADGRRTFELRTVIVPGP